MCPDMRESLRLDLVDADEAEEGRDRLLAAARTRASRPVAGATTPHVGAASRDFGIRVEFRL